MAANQDLKRLKFSGCCSRVSAMRVGNGVRNCVAPRAFATPAGRRLACVVCGSSFSCDLRGCGCELLLEHCERGLQLPLLSSSLTVGEKARTSRRSFFLGCFVSGARRDGSKFAFGLRPQTLPAEKT